MVEVYMSNKIFTQNQMKLLTCNKYVKNVSDKVITYTNEYKSIFTSEYEKENYQG